MEGRAAGIVTRNVPPAAWTVVAQCGLRRACGGRALLIEGLAPAREGGSLSEESTVLPGLRVDSRVRAGPAHVRGGLPSA